MSRLGCKTTWWDRCKRPGMVGAIGAVSGPSVQSAVSKWRRGAVAPSPAMLLRIVRAVPLAEVLLHERRLAMEKLEARRAVLRRILCRDLIHGGCKGAKVTLQHVADRSGIKRQCLQNFRAGDFALGEASVARLEAAMRDLGLLIEQCAAGRSA